MYNLPHFKEQDRNVVLQFMQQHAFATVIGTNGEAQPVATQVPLLIEDRSDGLYLLGHIQRKTDHHRAFNENANVLVLFTGPHTYVSASWYANPQTASTWNYVTVHATGSIRFLDDHALLDILTRTTRHFEANDASPAQVSTMPDEYIQPMMKAIIPFEIRVTGLDNVFKLSQNRDEANYDKIIERLQEQGGEAAAVAELMQARKDKVFRK